MHGLSITHRGSYAKDNITYSDAHQAHLLHEEYGFEAISECMVKGTIGYFYSVQETGIEFTYILKGAMEIRDGDESILLSAGDTYSHHSIQDNIMFRTLEVTELLCISTCPCYDHYQEDQQHLTDVLNQIQVVDGDTMNHCMRVKKLSLGIAYYMHYSQSSLEDLYYAANFHDVGKAKIPPEILLKPGRLTDEEYEIMKEHSRYTYEMIREYYGDTVANIAFEHHEHLDGRGYPRGLSGDQISMPARIICVADAYDAMVVTRPYRNGLSQETALAELHRCSGTQFDETVVNALEAYLRDL